MKNERDLRVVKTRTNIINALIALLKEKPMAEISVKELCERAMCSRNTFYLHFPYKEAVLDRLIEDCIDGIIDGTLALVGGIEDVDENIIERYNRNIIHATYASRDKIAFLQQYGGGCNFAKRLTDAVYSSFLENTLKLTSLSTADVRFRAYCRYLAGGTVNFILHWVKVPEIPEAEALSMLNSIHSASTRTAIEYLRAHGR